jgi:transcriptional regulator with XRE-family HTH domain
MEEFGKYLRRLREAQGFSLREAEEKAHVSASYLVQIETGKRGPPGPDILKRLAPVYDVPVRDLLRAAGHLIETPRTTLSDEEEVDLAFRYVMADPRYKSGARVKGELTTDVKRFIVEMYERATGKSLLPGD